MDVLPAYDVAVVGYGPTGVTAANLLGRAGLRVLVIERDAEVFTRARAISTDEEVLRVWQRAGLAERLKEDMLAGAPIDYVDDRGRSFLSLAPLSRGHGHPPQAFIYQPALEEVLRAGVSRYPNVDLLVEHEAVRFRQDDDGVELTVLDLRDDSVSRVRAAYVIAADGGSSPTRGQLGIGFEGRTYQDRWLVVDTEVVQEWPGHDRLRFHCDPRRPAVDCPTPLGHHRWEYPVLPGEDEHELVSEASVWRLLNRQGITERQVRVMRATIYSHHVRFAARWRAGRIFLAGDAAHVMPPWIGQGMAAGVRDVANLCWKLAGVLDGSLPEGILDSYEAERQPHVRAMTKQAVFFGRVITERRRAIAALRNLAFRAIRRVPPAAAWFRDADWLPAARYRSGFLSGSGHAAVGHLPPQPWTRDPSGARVLLDDVAAGGWTVICADDCDGHPAWDDAGATTIRLLPEGGRPAPGQLIDADGTLLAWMRQRKASVLALRPDGFVHSAAVSCDRLPAPPVRPRVDGTLLQAEEVPA